MDIEGKVKLVKDTEVFASGFQKRTLIIEKEDGNYTSQYGVIAMKENVTLFDGLEVGDDVKISVYDNTVAKVREWEGKWFPDMPTAHKVLVDKAGVPAEENKPADDGIGEEGDIPF